MRGLFLLVLAACAIWSTKGSVYVDAKEQVPRVCGYIKENHIMMDVQQDMVTTLKGMLDSMVDHPQRQDVVLTQYKSYRESFTKLIKKLEASRKAHHTIYGLNCEPQSTTEL